MARKPRLPEPQSLIARIEHFEQTYFISHYPEHRAPVSDEALIEIKARIEQISPKLKQHVGESIAVTLGCAQSFTRDEPAPDNPSLLSVNLSNKARSLMAYLPAASFWWIPSLIERGKGTHIEARFAPIRYGRGDLQTLFFATSQQIAELYASLEH